jgi:hypothetical protein
LDVKPIDYDILGAVLRRWSGDDRWVNEILDKPEHLIERRMERLIDRGYLECGVSTRTAWLTDKGFDELAGQTQEEAAELGLRMVGGRNGLRDIVESLTFNDLRK